MDRSSLSENRCALVLAGAACFGGCAEQRAPESDERTVTDAQAVAGNIEPDAIQIDGPANNRPGADLFADVGAPLNAGANVDWVADSAPNAGTGCLVGAIASCIEADVTGASGGVGHWNGVRIVDGIDGADQDIFLTGGKENEPTTWNPGPGTVGSSKYDITQAYLANNQRELFFGMERRGNNGTTAFDFEFNQLAPMALPGCPQSPIIPCRSANDVLFTFEMKGSGGSGSATPFIFTFDGTSYVPGAPAGILSSINDSTSTAGAPWGHVDSRGDWVLGDMDRFSLAEAVAPLSVLPGVNACGGTAYVQVRTRSSSTATSDLKDLTKVFEFVLNRISIDARLGPSCEAAFTYSVATTGADGNPIANPICHWEFSNGASSDDCSGTLAAAPGSHTGTVEVRDPDAPGCLESQTTDPVTVYPPLTVEASLTASCTSSFGYVAVASGGSDPANASYAWTFAGGGTTTPSSSTSSSGSVAVGTPAVAYTGEVVVTDPRTDLVCSASDSDDAVPFAPLAVDLALQGQAGTCPSLASDAAGYLAVPSGGDGNYAFEWNGAACAGAACTIDPSDSLYCHDQSLSVTVSDGSELCPPAESETERYAKVTTVSASDNP